MPLFGKCSESNPAANWEACPTLQSLRELQLPREKYSGITNRNPEIEKRVKFTWRYDS